MKLLTTSNEIREQIKSLRPTHVAVAYIGSDWEEFVDHKSIKAFVVAPMLGSNPDAIGELAQKLGWENVHLLDNLHAKIYMTDERIIVGSANLSRNALDADGLIEMCVILNDREIIKGAKDSFDAYIDQASKLYRTEQDKIVRLEHLRKRHNRAIEEGIIKNSSRERKFSDYNVDAHGHFYVGWYVVGSYDYEYESLKTHFPKLTEKQIDKAICDQMPFSPKDSLQNHKWILCWRLGRRRSLSWLYIHEIYEDACRNKGYENLAVQLRNRNTPSPPFSLQNDKVFAGAFKNVIESGEFDEFLDKQRKPWLYKSTLRKFPDFIKRIREEYDKLS